MVTYEMIRKAKEIISPHVIRTPLVYSPTFSSMTGADVYLKLETLQKAGSFKVRGAANRILGHRDEIGSRGVITASAGNHAQGVAVAAHIAGVKATIVMPVHASLGKQEASKGYGAEIILQGDNLQESIEIATGLSESTGATFIHPYNDPEIIAGQGTVGVEIMEDLPDAGMIVVPVGGGGLISGIATAVKAKNPGIHIIGVQAAACPSAYTAIREGGPVRVTPGYSVADGILVPRVGDETYPVLKSLLDDVVLVSEDEIIEAMLLLIERKKIIAEGAGAVPLAALLHDHLPVQKGENIVLVLSGGNIDSPLLARVIEKGLLRQGRIMRVSARLPDVPGSLVRLLSLVAGSGGNVLSIRHSANLPGLPLDVVVAEVTIETRGHEHSREISRVLDAAGFIDHGPGQPGRC
jgi:threonine dehydratase